ncbi:MAG: ATP-dependent 6-phosphofructokinase, partial [Oscillospiraceae bacterium]
LVVIGGDGSFRGCQAIAKKGIKCVGIPGTIDNDISCSDYTIGFDTALNTAMEMIDRIRDTTQSHERCSLVEVMGRHSGYLAINTGIANGAMCILIPEREYDIHQNVIAKMKESQKEGKKNFLIIVAEGVGNVMEMAKIIQSETGIETRATILGHVQRGGSPSSRDRLLAALMGCRAVELLKDGEYNRVVALKEYKVVSYDIDEALEMKKSIDPEFLHVAEVVSI